MIAEIMRKCNRYWPRTYENITLTFDADAKTITGDFGETYLAGQYILVKYSVLNDGIFTVSSFDSDTGVITVSETVRDEATKVSIFALTPPRDFLDLVSEIETHVSNNEQGLSSEKIDDYSKNYASGSSNWEDVFRKRLSAYSAINSDLGAIVYGNNQLLFNDRDSY